MLEWLGDVPDSIWVALVTGGLLALQNWTNNRREDRRVAAERLERMRERDHVARVALEEHWRDERRGVYQTFQRFVDEAMSFGTTSVSLLGAGREPSGPGSALEKFDVLVSQAMPPALTQISLIGSDDTAEAAKVLHADLRTLNMAISVDQQKMAREALEKCRNACQGFLRRAREDLGTP